MTKEEFIQKLHDMMIVRGYNQKDLAKDTGLTESAISNYLNGIRTPNMKSLHLLSEALDYDFGQKIYKENSKRVIMDDEEYVLISNELIEELIENQKEIDRLVNKQKKLLESLL